MLVLLILAVILSCPVSANLRTSLLSEVCQNSTRTFCERDQASPRHCKDITDVSTIQFEYTGYVKSSLNDHSCDCDISEPGLFSFQIINVTETFTEPVEKLMKNTKCTLLDVTRTILQPKAPPPGLSLLTCQDDNCKISIFLHRARPEPQRQKEKPAVWYERLFDEKHKEMLYAGACGVVLGILLGAGGIGCCVARCRNTNKKPAAKRPWSWRAPRRDASSHGEYENRKPCCEVM